MQIRDIVGRKKTSLREGVFDTLRAAATWEPGETFAQAKAKVKNDAGVQKVAKKAQAAWQSYEQQIRQYVSSLPPPQQKPAATTAGAKPQGPMPGRRVRVSYQAPNQTNPSFYFKTSTGWTNELNQPVTDPKSIQALDASAAKGGKEEPDPNYKEPGASQAKKTRGPRRRMEEQAAPGSALDAYQKRTDGRYEQALKAFVQKNLLSGMPYARLQNAQEIDQLIKTMSQPQNADPRVQAPLWQQLAMATAVAAVVPQSAGGAGPEPTGAEGGDNDQHTQSPRELVEPITQAMAKNQVDLAKPGAILRKDFTNGETAIRSTGNPNVDAMLLAMGFTL
jgi:hypothetical protein